MITPAQRIRQCLLLCSLALLAVLTGCSGCQSGNEDEKLTKEELAKKKEREKDALIVGDPTSLPIDKDRKLLIVKPGHWHETVQTFKANREDMQVQLVSGIYYGADKANLPSTNFVNEYSRRTTLAKGQEKTVGLQVYIPPTTKKKVEQTLDASGVTPLTALRINSELRAVPLMNPIPNSDKRPVANELKPYTFQLAVLCPKVLDYQFLSNMDAIRWMLSDKDFDNERIISYDVALVAPKDNQYPFPHSILTMTAMAAIVWDDVSIDELTVDQQTAIVDWLHWGGQLIINGPTSWSRLQGSFLSPYLPATSAESTELSTDSFKELSSTWETTNIHKSAVNIPIEIGVKASGLKFQLNEKGAWLEGTGQMVAESQVGRGRIVVSAFSLRDPAIVRWSYYSSFISTGLLRRPSREIKVVPGEFASQRQYWTAPFANQESLPQLHSNFRMLTRDLPATVDADNSKVPGGGDDSNLTPSSSNRVEVSPGVSVPAAMVRQAPTADASSLAARLDYEPTAWGGAGAWTDYSGVAVEAITALRAAAGIELPERATILKLLAGYLICLVPLNWLVFKLIRKLEYAWLAAPIMALIGVVVVGKVARLDIGFARRTTEISVLEAYGDYSRAHLTQYVALYTSLSTNYTVEFPETDSVALPMGDVQREMRRAQMSIRNLQTSYGKSDGVMLEPLTVYSNSTEMLHAEQMVKLDSPIRLSTDEAGKHVVFNSASFPIMGATLVRRTSSKQLEIAWLDALGPGEKQPVTWIASDPGNAFENWANQINTQPVPPSENELSEMDGIWIGGLLHQIGKKTPLMDGQIRLIGYTKQSMGQLKIAPSQDQYDSMCVVVAHLTPVKLGPVSPDRNISTRDVESVPTPQKTSDAPELQPQL